MLHMKKTENLLPIDRYKDKSKWSSLRRAQYVFIKDCISKTSLSGKLLDVGSGAHHFEDLYRTFNKTAIDFAPYEGTDVIHNLEDGLPFEDGQYHVVASSNTFEHIYAPQMLINECFRVTENGGFIVGSTPFMLMVHQEPYDYFRYTDYALRRMLSDAGYVDIVIVPLGTPNDLLAQMTSHFFAMLEGGEKRYSTRIFWKMQVILQRVVVLLFGNLKPSMKYNLGYGFFATKRAV